MNETRKDSEIISDFPAYALGALDEDEQRAVEDLVERDGDAFNELAEMLDTVADFSAQLGDVAPSIAMRDRLIAAARSESGASDSTLAYSTLVSHLEQRIASEEVEVAATQENGFWQRLGGMVTAGRLAFATSIASFVVVSIMAVQLGADNVELNRKIAEMEDEVAVAYSHSEEMMDAMSASEQLVNQAHARISRQDEELVRLSAVNDALRSSMNDQISLTYATLRNEYGSPAWQPDAVSSGSGYAYLLEHKEQPLGALVIGGVEPAPDGEEYRLYLISDEQAHYMASFDMNAAGYSTVLFELPFALDNYNGAHITLERSTDAPDPSLSDPEKRYRPQ